MSQEVTLEELRDNPEVIENCKWLVAVGMALSVEEALHMLWRVINTPKKLELSEVQKCIERLSLVAARSQTKMTLKSNRPDIGKGMGRVIKTRKRK